VKAVTNWTARHRAYAVTWRFSIAAAAALALAGCEPPAVPLPATGRTVTVAMEGRAPANWFQPALVRVRPGDAVRWVMRSGSPHTVRFETAALPPAVRAQLAANFEPASRAHRSPRRPYADWRPGRWDSPMLAVRGATFTLSFAGIPPGRYPYQCGPHGALGMRGVVEVVAGGAGAAARPPARLPDPPAGQPRRTTSSHTRSTAAPTRFPHSVHDPS